MRTMMQDTNNDLQDSQTPNHEPVQGEIAKLAVVSNYINHIYFSEKV